MYAPGSDSKETLEALTAFLDLLFDERGVRPLAPFTANAREIQARWFQYLMPGVSSADVAELLNERRYVIVQGPPGTGKTRMALQLIKTEYQNRGQTIQFHANTTYENFVGGLAPRTSAEGLGFQFAPQKGFLIKAAEAATNSSGKYLLHIDEINRADLSKVLGEAIYLIEPDDHERIIDLPYKFEPPTADKLSLPENLHILGTMNSSDRSLAIMDVAIRRRFAFAKLWPQTSVLVEEQNSPLMLEAFQKLLTIFIDHATEGALELVPGHSYFLEANDLKARRRLKATLKPLLEDYLLQGYVSAFAEDVRSYLQWIDSL
jgi:5-methylcytosine-specific restriction protein B